MNARELLEKLDLGALRAELCRRSFAAFVAQFWACVTGMPLVENEVILSITRALQDVGDGRTPRLLIAVPPGTGKSTLLCLYAAWRLARDPSHRSIHASHAFALAATESRRVRRLIDGDVYRRMFPHVALRDDEQTVEHWATTRDGRYFAVGTDGALTGRRANELVVDDPMNAADRHSRAVRDAVYTWLAETATPRLDGDRAPVIVVAQRLDRDDLIGRLLEAGGWTLLELPAEREDGTLIAPNVLPRDKLDALKLQIGSATYACQFLQRPSDDSNATIKRSWWRFHRPVHVAENAPRPTGCDPDVPAILTPDRFDRQVVACDLTFGSKKGDYAVAQLWGARGAARFLLAQWRKRAGLLESVAAIKELARPYPSAKIIVEKAALGAGAVEELTAAGLPNVVGVPPLGSKATRLGLVSATIEAGNALLPLGVPWLGDFVEELAGATKHDDQSDAASYGLHELNVAAPDPRATVRNWVVLSATRSMSPEELEREVDRVLATRRHPNEPLAAFGRGWWARR